jgi:hypothetical protein
MWVSGKLKVKVACTYSYHWAFKGLNITDAICKKVSNKSYRPYVLCI